MQCIDELIQNRTCVDSTIIRSEKLVGVASRKGRRFPISQWMVENRRLGATEQRWFSHWGSGCLAARQLWCRPLCLLHNTAHRVSELLYWTEAKCKASCTCWSWSCTCSSWSCTGWSCTVYRLEAKQRCGAHSFGPWGVSTLNTSGQHRSLLFFDIYTYIFQDYQRHQKKRDGSFKITLCKCRKKSRKSFSVCD